MNISFTCGTCGHTLRTLERREPDECSWPLSFDRHLIPECPICRPPLELHECISCGTKNGPLFPFPIMGTGEYGEYKAICPYCAHVAKDYLIQAASYFLP